MAHYSIAGTVHEAQRPAAGLYLVSTPIGNLGDISLRALETLAGADLILCEDTRHSARLLDHYGIIGPRKSLHEHNERERVDEVLAQLADGKAIAVISDAGTPLLSDPGYPLVRAARGAGLPVFAVPGASALLSALAVSGLPTDAFTFVGFLPPKAVARRNRLDELRTRPETLVFYESPRRLGATLATMAEVFGDGREAAVALELTKRFERVERDALAMLAAHYADAQTKGEAVILVAGAPAGEVAITEAEWQSALAAALVDQPLRSAVDEIATRFGVKRKQVYDAALAIRSGAG